MYFAHRGSDFQRAAKGREGRAFREVRRLAKQAVLNWKKVIHVHTTQPTSLWDTKLTLCTLLKITGRVMNGDMNSMILSGIGAGLPQVVA